MVVLKASPLMEQYFLKMFLIFTKDMSKQYKTSVHDIGLLNTKSMFAKK